jgi:excisionase family DNA binding protein
MADLPTTISLAEAAERLGVHYMTAYRYVRTGRLEAVKQGAEWQVETNEVDRMRAQSAADRTPTRTRNTRAHEYPRRLVERLIAGDEAGSWSVIEGALTAGMTPDEVYLDLLRPALHTIGERWAQGSVTVAQEHQASAIVLRLIGRLGPRFVRRGRKRGTVLLGAPPGDVHGLPSALLTDLLRGRGFEVIDLGADVPADSWASATAALARVAAIGLCATTPDNHRNVRDAIEHLRRVSDAPIVLGGNAIASGRHATDLGADQYSDSFAQAAALLDDAASTPRPR